MPLNPPDIKELKAIVDWVNLTKDVRELSIRFADVELFISRNENGHDRNRRAGAQPVVAQASVPTVVAETALATVVGASAPAVAQAAEPAPATASASFSIDSLTADEAIVKAPMVGIFYASPKPGDPPFVSVGDSVTASTVVGIVEVMKLMNNLEAKIEGTVTKILVENEHAVEYGQPLMVIKRHA